MRTALFTDTETFGNLVVDALAGGPEPGRRRPRASEAELGPGCYNSATGLCLLPGEI